MHAHHIVNSENCMTKFVSDYITRTQFMLAMRFKNVGYRAHHVKIGTFVCL